MYYEPLVKGINGLILLIIPLKAFALEVNKAILNLSSSDSKSFFDSSNLVYWINNSLSIWILALSDVNSVFLKVIIYS